MQIFSYSLEPEWAAAATEVKEQTKGKVKLAAVDATVNQLLSSRYGVSVQEALALAARVGCPEHVPCHLNCAQAQGQPDNLAVRFPA